MRAAPVVLQLSTVASTMDALHELAQGGAAAGSVVVADEQAAGRGSRGRHWSSPPGGLWLSLLARPATTGLEVLSLRAGLAVAERLGALGIHLALKWPNDLMLGERKAGGILCEARWQGAPLAWVAIGVGLNVANPPAAGMATTATHLADAVPALTPAALVRPVVERSRAGSMRRPARSPATSGRASGAATGSAAVAPGAARRDRPTDSPPTARCWSAGRTEPRRRSGPGTVVLAGTSPSADLRPCS